MECILASRGYRLWLETGRALHRKWPQLPYHLWIMNVQSVGLLFVIIHSDTVQFPFSRLVFFPGRPVGLSPQSHHLRFTFKSQTVTLVNEVSAAISLGRRCYRDARAFTYSCYSKISQIQRLYCTCEMTICVAFEPAVKEDLNCLSLTSLVISAWRAALH